MPKRAVNIDSYLSLPTDLAAEMRSWEEFVTGSEYNVTLRSGHEDVSTSLEEDERQPFVLASGNGDGPLSRRSNAHGYECNSRTLP